MTLRRAIGLVAFAELAYPLVLLVLVARVMPVNDLEAEAEGRLGAVIGTGLLAGVSVVLLATVIVMAKRRANTRRAIRIERVTLAGFAVLQLILAVAGVMTFLTDPDPGTARPWGVVALVSLGVVGAVARVWLRATASAGDTAVPGRVAGHGVADDSVEYR